MLSYDNGLRYIQYYKLSTIHFLSSNFCLKPLLIDLSSSPIYALKPSLYSFFYVLITIIRLETSSINLFFVIILSATYYMSEFPLVKSKIILLYKYLFPN